MNEKKGDIFFRDFHGNFHKLNITDMNQELSEISEFDNFIFSTGYDEIDCYNKKYKYFKLNVKNIKNSNTSDNCLILEPGMYRFCIYLTINTNKYQKIYFFIRDEKIIESSLQLGNTYLGIPNNLNFNFMIEIKKPKKLQVGIISEEKLTSIKSNILFSRII